jgi:macrolide-specific efflux system membrane fusion protein
LLLVFGVIGAAIAGSMGAMGLLGGRPEVTVFTAKVVLGAIEDTVLAAGELQPARMLSVGAQVSGQIKDLHVVLGQSVKAGDPIAEIDSTAQRNALRVAEAALANITAQRIARQAQLQQVEANYGRQRDLLTKQAASQVDFETANSALLTLRAEIAALTAQIEQSSVEVENARANVGYTKIVAPIDGVVIAVVTKAGQTLNANQSTPTIVVLAQLDTMAVRVRISEADIGRVTAGQRAWFTILGDQNTRFEASIGSIEPAPASIVSEANAPGTSTSGTTAVYYNGLFEIPNADGRLRPLMTAQVHIVIASVSNVPLIPWTSLGRQEPDGRYHVQVRTAGGALEDRLIGIGINDKIEVEVTGGLNVGDDVVISDGGVEADPVMM